MWYFGSVVYEGNSRRSIRPYKDIEAHNFAGDRKKNSKRISQAKGAIAAIDAYIRDLANNYSSLPVSERDQVWSAAMSAMAQHLAEVAPEKKRKTPFQDMDYTSIYENYLLHVNKCQRLR